MLNNKKDDIFFIVCFTLPQFILFGIFIIYPIFSGLYYSLTSYSGLIKAPEFIGLKNFVMLFTKDKYVYKGLLNTIYFLFSVSVPTMIIAMFYSTVIVRLKVKFGDYYRMIFFLPNSLSIVIITILWIFIYNPTMGFINPLLHSIGLGKFAFSWLGDKRFVHEALSITMIWPAVGFQILFYIAGIQNIPESLYESAKIDGASELRQFFKITLPLMSEILIISVNFFIIQAFNGTFGYVWIMTEAGPNHATELLTTWIYQKAFRDANFGYAASIGLFLFVICVIFSIAFKKIMRKNTVEF